MTFPSVPVLTEQTRGRKKEVALMTSLENTDAAKKRKLTH
jgi:hypothetical protein